MIPSRLALAQLALLLAVLPAAALQPAGNITGTAGKLYAVNFDVTLVPEYWILLYGTARPDGIAYFQIETRQNFDILGPDQTLKAAYLTPARYAPPCLTQADWLFLSRNPAVDWSQLVPATLDQLNKEAGVKPGSAEDATNLFKPEGPIGLAGRIYANVPTIRLDAEDGPSIEYAFWDVANKAVVFAFPLHYPSVQALDGAWVNYHALVPRNREYFFQTNPNLCRPFVRSQPAAIKPPAAKEAAPAEPKAEQPKTEKPKTETKDAPKEAPKDKPAALPEKPQVPQPKPENVKPDAPAVPEAPITPIPILDAAPPEALPPEVPPPVEVAAELEPEPDIPAGEQVTVSVAQTPQAAVSAQVSIGQTTVTTRVAFEEPGEQSIILDYPFPVEYFQQGLATVEMTALQDAGNAVQTAQLDWLSFDTPPTYQLVRAGNATRVIWLLEAVVGQVYDAKMTIKKALTPERIQKTRVHTASGDVTRKIARPTPTIANTRLQVTAQPAATDAGLEILLWAVLAIAVSLLSATAAMLYRRPWMLEYLGHGKKGYLWHFFNPAGRLRRRGK